MPNFNIWALVYRTGAVHFGLLLFFAITLINDKLFGGIKKRGEMNHVRKTYGIN